MLSTATLPSDGTTIWKANFCPNTWQQRRSSTKGKFWVGPKWKPIKNSNWAQVIRQWKSPKGRRKHIQWWEDINRWNALCLPLHQYKNSRFFSKIKKFWAAKGNAVRLDWCPGQFNTGQGPRGLTLDESPSVDNRISPESKPVVVKDLSPFPVASSRGVKDFPHSYNLLLLSSLRLLKIAR